MVFSCSLIKPERNSNYTFSKCQKMMHLLLMYSRCIKKISPVTETSLFTLQFIYLLVQISIINMIIHSDSAVYIIISVLQYNYTYYTQNIWCNTIKSETSFLISLESNQVKNDSNDSANKNTPPKRESTPYLQQNCDYFINVSNITIYSNLNVTYPFPLTMTTLK